MSAEQLKTLAKIIKSGWKDLANADQTEADEVRDILKEVLEKLEAFEASVE